MFRSALGVLGVVLAAPTAHAASLHTVGASADYSTIQDAIDAATAGDIIVVLDSGVYAECLSVDKDLTLVGSRVSGGGVGVNCSVSSEPTVDVSGTKFTMVGVDVTHDDGRGLLARASDVTLADVTFDGLKHDDSGAAILVDGGSLSMQRSKVLNAVAGQSGGAIYADGSTVLLRSVQFDGNSSSQGGAAFFEGSSVILQRSSFDSNVSSGSGGAIVAEGGATAIRNSSFTSNAAAGDGGAVWFDGTSTHAVTATAFESNASGGSGGGLFTKAPTVINGSTFDQNTAVVDGGGGYSGSNLSLSASVIQNNTADEQGGGWLFDAASNVIDTHFEDNRAIDGGGAYLRSGTFIGRSNTTALNESTGNGGGLYREGGNFFDRNSRYDSNISGADGGGLYLVVDSSSLSTVLTGVAVEANEASSGSGGGIYFGDEAYFQLNRSEIYNNVAQVGGGVFVGDSPMAATIAESRIYSNEAVDGGGVAQVSTSLDTSNSRFLYLHRVKVMDNVATGDGGGLYGEYGGLWVRDSWLTTNETSGDGGGWYMTDAFGAYVGGSIICGNTATKRGGGLAWFSVWGTKGLSGVALVENSAGSEGGAAYIGDYSPTTGFQNFATFYYATVLGNDSTGTLFDGIHVDNNGSYPTTTYLYYGQYGFQAYSSVSQSTGSSGGSPNAQVRSNVFSGGTRPILNSAPYKAGDTYGNVSLNPGWVSYSAGDCYDDDLRSSDYTSYGAQAIRTQLDSRRLYVDGDGDGVTLGEGDCNDSNSSRYPGNTEIAYNNVDEDCIGDDVFDQDGDGFSSTSVSGTDCDDSDATVYPGAPDVPYDANNADCGSADDDDADGDGFVGVSAGGLDCDDADPLIYPGAIESAFDGVDQDCDSLDQDFDADGFTGEFTDSGGLSLSAPGLGEVDCAPADADVNPDEIEVWYDGVDQDCLGNDDYDKDGDGDRSLDEDPSGVGGDCDDEDPTRSSLTPEVYYDGFDQNCDDLSDYDADLDGDDSDEYGGNDCDDNDPAIFGGAPDIKDGLDNDCDFKRDNDDDGDGVLNWYEVEEGTNPSGGGSDSDGDGISDGVEWPNLDTHEDQLAPLDSDGDGRIDALDTDSDNDSIPDADEAGPNKRNPVDTDGDGLPDYRDADDDNDGFPTVGEVAGGIKDTDNDGIPNHLDVDSDNDGAHDAAEGTGDFDGDGIPDYLDAGSDIASQQEPAPPGERGFGLGCSSTGGVPTGALFGLGLVLLGLRRRRS